jgi:RNA polymerase sigma factor (TIGR02999 family)
VSDDSTAQLTRVLSAASRGDPQAASELLPLVYAELRRLAAARLAREPAGLTLQATALVHEAYMRLVAGGDPGWDGRAHFFGAAAEAMRRILVERARQRKQLKRGGGRKREPLDSVVPADLEEDGHQPIDAIALSDALEGLEKLDPRLATIIKLRCFIGLTIAEAAEALGLSTRTVDRDWLVAKAWLRKQLAGEQETS